MLNIFLGTHVSPLNNSIQKLRTLKEGAQIIFQCTFFSDGHYAKNNELVNISLDEQSLMKWRNGILSEVIAAKS